MMRRCGGSGRDRAARWRSASSPRPRPGSQTKSGGTFRLGTSSRIDSLNPYVAFNQDAYSAFEYIYPFLDPVRPANLHFAPDFARSWSTSKDGKTWTFKTVANAKWSDGQPLTAADAAWTINTDVKYQAGGAANAAGLIAHIKTRRGAEPDDARRPLRGAGRQRARPVPAVPDPAAARLEQVHRPQGRRPEDLREHGAGRRRRPVQARQVQEGPDRALPAQRLVLRAEAADRRVRAADVLERRRARLRAQGARASTRSKTSRRPRSRRCSNAGFAIKRRPGRRPDRLHHQLQPEEDEAPRAPQPQGRRGVRPRDRPRRRSCSVVFLGTAKPAARSSRAATGSWYNPAVKPTSFDLALANKLLDSLGYKSGSGGIRVAERPEDVVPGDHADRPVERQPHVPDHPDRLPEDRRAADAEGARLERRLRRDHGAERQVPRTSTSRCGTGWR